jgi:hypothetical protein
MWERAQQLVKVSGPIPSGRLRNKHAALLNGIFYCDSCRARMVYSYAMKDGRRYPYYVCLNAQRKGWATCPGKSLPVVQTEASVLNQIRQAGFSTAAEWEKMDLRQQMEALKRWVSRIGFDGVTRKIRIELRAEKP